MNEEEKCDTGLTTGEIKKSEKIEVTTTEKSLMIEREKMLAKIVKDFIGIQERRIANQLAILSIAKNALIEPPAGLETTSENKQAASISQILKEWKSKTKESADERRIPNKTEENKEDKEEGEEKEKIRFEMIVKRISEVLQNTKGKSWEKYGQQLLWLEELQKMIWEKQPLENIILFIEPYIENRGAEENIEYHYFLYRHYYEMENYTDNLMKTTVMHHPVWRLWLSEVKGIDLRLAAKFIGILASAFKEEEGPGHYRTISQCWSYSGLGVTNGKAAKRTKGEPLTFNNDAKAILLGQIGTSLLRAKGSYYNLYKGRREVERRKGTSNVHRRALRWMVKLFVSHGLEIWWKAYGLPVADEKIMEHAKAGHLPYAYAILGHGGESYIPPIRDRQAKIYRKRKDKPSQMREIQEEGAASHGKSEKNPEQVREL